MGSKCQNFSTLFVDNVGYSALGEISILDYFYKKTKNRWIPATV